MDAIPPRNRLGLYTGWIGVALAAARVGALLGEDALLDQASVLARRAALQPAEGREFDLLSGIAGGIAGLVVLRDALDDPSLLDLATPLGDELLRSADKTDAGFSWASEEVSGGFNLTGFSHGTAGIGWALMELSCATGQGRWRQAAEEAFRYERHWFDPASANWPDFRQTPRSGSKPSVPPPSAIAWCHGAPGIALSRLRAWMLLGDEVYWDEAVTALATTEAAVEAALQAVGENFSLCHGVAGIADIMCYGAGVLKEETRQDRRSGAGPLARRIAAMGIDRYGRPGRLWPCGITGTTPGLLLGLAGIGHFYLRQYDATIPSILMWREHPGKPTTSTSEMAKG